MTLAQKIRQIRKRAGLNQAHFAKALGVSQSQVSKWENLAKPENPGRDNLIKIACFADISVDELLDMAKNGRLAPVVAEIRMNDEMAFLKEITGDRAVIAPDGAPLNAVAAQISGRAFGTVFAGWYVFYDPTRSPPHSDVIGKLCVIGLTDGTVVVKKIDKGQIEGRYNLISMSGPPIYDAQVEWVSLVTHLAQGQ